jgi:phospholipase C
VGHSLPRSISRHTFLAATAAAVSGLVAGCTRGPEGLSETPSLDPQACPIDHIVLVMMENRSFDHLLGWLPGADGRQAGLTYVDSSGTAHQTYPLAPDFQGCGLRDPDHTRAGGLVEYNEGACDGWLRANDVYAIGYYRKDDLPFLGQAAVDWTSFDRYFCPILAETFPNRLYQHAGQTDRLHNSTEISTLPTIWDRLAARGLEGRYYYSDLPFLALWGSKYRAIARPVDALFLDCAAGTLPHVAFVDPRFLRGEVGDSGDDHPFGDIRAGETFLNQVYAAVTTSPAWNRSMLFINFDEWGGFFDHVAPPVAAIPTADAALGIMDGRRGFRTPALLISPYARRHHISHVVYDHTSVLRMIQWRWGLEPLSERDAMANNLALELPRTSAALDAPVYRVPTVIGAPCIPTAPTLAPAPRSASSDQWHGLRDVARRHGWAV